MSDDLTDSQKAHVLRGLRYLVMDGVRAKRSRDDIIESLRQRGLKRQTASAFLDAIESSHSGLTTMLDRNDEDLLIRRLQAVVHANYD